MSWKNVRPAHSSHPIQQIKIDIFSVLVDRRIEFQEKRKKTRSVWLLQCGESRRKACSAPYEMYATSPQRKNVTKYLNIQNTQSSIIIYVYGVADAVHFHGICPKKISRLSFYAILFLMRLQKNCTKYHPPCLAIRRESTATKSIWMMYYGTRDSRQLRGHHKPTFYKI